MSQRPDTCLLKGQILAWLHFPCLSAQHSILIETKSLEHPFQSNETPISECWNGHFRIV